MNIIILGPQGSGKSTQAGFLAEELNLPLFDMGEFLRAKSEEQSELGKKIKGAVERGELVDDATSLSLLSAEIKDPKYRKGVVLDGVPRTLNQAKLLERILKIDKVLYLTVPDEINIKRLLKRGREDDTPEIIKRRLSLYHKNTQPALSYYREKRVLSEIDGTKTSDEVFKDILAHLANFQ